MPPTSSPPPPPPPRWEETTPVLGPVEATLGDHEKRIRATERCTGRMASSLEHMDKSLSDLSGLIKAKTEDEQKADKARPWKIVGVSAAFALTIAAGLVGYGSLQANVAATRDDLRTHRASDGHPKLRERVSAVETAYEEAGDDDTATDIQRLERRIDGIYAALPESWRSRAERETDDHEEP